MHGEPPVVAHDHRSARRARRLDALVRALDDVPRTRPDELREFVLVPRHLARRDVAAVLGQDTRLPPVQLCEPNEVLLVDARRPRRHRPPVELPHACGDRRAAGEAPVECVACAPRIGAQEESPLLGQTAAEAARGEDDRRRGVGREPGLKAHVHAGREHLGECARIEALARRPRVLGVLPDRRGAERDEPRKRVVETFPHEPLQRLVAARALGAEVLPLEMPPDDAAGEEHRATRAGPLLDHDRVEAELTRTHGGDEPGHAGSGNEHYRSEKVGLCSTYSMRTFSGPRRNTAYVFGASTTSSISTPRSCASAMCSSAESTSTAM